MKQIFKMPGYELPCLDLKPLSPSLQQLARDRCCEHPDTRLQAVSELRDIIYERGEITPHMMDDNYLIRFLRVRRFDTERAYRLMVRYYRFKDECPEVFRSVNPFSLRCGNVFSLPSYIHPEWGRLIIYRVANWEPGNCSVEDLLRGSALTLELGSMEPRTQVLGAVMLFDLQDLALHHVRQFNSTTVSSIAKLMGLAFPMTINSFHIVNNSWIFDKLYYLFTPFINASVRSKIFFHGYDLQSLHKHIPPKYLPEQYGGTCISHSYPVWMEGLRVKRDEVYMKELHSLGYVIKDEDMNRKVKGIDSGYTSDDSGVSEDAHESSEKGD